jgi:RNA polymerase sigma factor (sigma-70 family)
MEQPAIVTDQPARKPLIYLSPVLPVDGPIPHELERILSAVARTAGQGDRIARDSLYWALAGRLEPALRRMYRLHTVTHGPALLELDDVRQSGYLVFVDMMDTWRPDDSFASYLFGMFVWRLRDELRRYEKRRETTLSEAHPVRARDNRSNAELLERLLARLPERQREIVRLRLNRNLSFIEIGAVLGVSSRTIRRDMQAITEAVRDGLTG